MKANTLIHAKNLTKIYGNAAVVDNVSFAIPKGNIAAIIGPNGAGKTTLVRMLMGIVKPTKGTIRINGKEPREERTSIGYVPQRFNYNPRVPITIREFLMLSLHVAGKRNNEKIDIIERRLQDVGLTDVLDKQLFQLSGGQLQRMLIARALLTDKKLLILDEPVAGIDINGKQSIYELLKELNIKHGITTVLISHELDVVFKYADSVLCMNHRMLCHGKPKEALTWKIFNEMYGMDHFAYYHHHDCAHKK